MHPQVVAIHNHPFEPHLLSIADTLRRGAAFIKALIYQKF